MNENVLAYIIAGAIASGTPLLLGTLGEIYSERSGVLNLGVEGIMAVGAVTGFAVTLKTGNPWFGFFAASFCGLILSLIHGFVSITLRANQTIAGLALSMIGLGLSGLVGKSYIGIPLKNRFDSLNLVEGVKLPPYIKVFFELDPIAYLSICLSIILWVILFKTKWGIYIRSAGENPKAVESAGLNVNLIRYLSVITGGLFFGMAGAYLSLCYTPSWIEGMTAGRGWIVIALTVFALWNPARAVLGAYLFGGIYAVQYLLQNTGISANLLLMLPYFVTIFALIISTQGKKYFRAPSALGVPYIKGEK